MGDPDSQAVKQHTWDKGHGVLPPVLSGLEDIRLNSGHGCGDMSEIYPESKTLYLAYSSLQSAGQCMVVKPAGGTDNKAIH